MSALDEDAPASDENNHAYVMDLREIFIHVCGDRAIDRAHKVARAISEIQEIDSYFKFWFYMIIYVRRETKDELIFTKCHDVLERLCTRLRKLDPVLFPSLFEERV